MPTLVLLFLAIQFQLALVSTFSFIREQPLSSHDAIRVSITKTNEDILSLADLRYREWMSDDPDPPNLYSFRLATADIFRERKEEGSIVFLATASDADGNDGRGEDRGREKRVAVGAAESSPVEFKGVFVGDEDESSDGRREAVALYVTDVVASSAHRRRGIGSKLMDAVERNALETGTRFLFLHVEHDNIGARRFYERLGYGCVDVKTLAGDGHGEEDGVISFPLEEGRLPSAVRTTKPKAERDHVAMDVKRLAGNAGTVGQLLMMKNLSQSTSKHVRISASQPTFPSSQSSSKATTNDPSTLAGGGFGKPKDNSRRKNRKR